ncbi:MAG: bifunctional phosphoribosylaminoimidazolecarboxamide formyltransferase/IMP cyclohydrolase [Thermoanaerobaculales bacterium]|jgi:phosphoribosylaminoimidazolecarboxamide formyltransferase/IMP cyclohydrolase|nr:bifunctional phosphoribosylaminoimidazolecarboxamide formyltransferase/IMP cyclohydrolase [Thermoanaerobaculales bacterium]
MTKLALISVSDKRGLNVLGPRLVALGWTLLSTGGTARALADEGCEVVAVGDHTGFPEILDGRVKTLHPRVFAGILAAPVADHLSQLSEHGIPPIDLVVVNLYPFRETVARAEVGLAEAVEQIDIGGPSLIRAAAKNHARVTVVVDPADYPALLAELAAGAPSEATRQRLAVKAFAHTAAYDAAISAALPRLLGGADADSTPAAVAEELLSGERRGLRYGENPHQWGMLVRRPGATGLAGASQIQGKELSYNNLGDATGAWRLVWDLPAAGVAVIKHANPCGVGLADDMAEAFRIARATDPLSAFGGVIAANRPVDGAFAAAVVEQFAEVVVAPGFDRAALETFAAKKNLRVLEASPAAPTGTVIRDVDGGLLLQQRDAGWQGEERRVATERAPTADESAALELAWRVVKHVGSNAIVVGAADRILGIGAGQMSRVDAAKIAVAKALEHGHDLSGSVAASDAFFPFPDGVESLHAAGVRAVIQPGGSIKDPEVIATCNALGIAMVLTGRRHFRH